MGRFDKVALATVTIGTLMGVIGTQSFAYRYYLDQISSGGLPVAAAGWAIATYGPIAAAVLFWRYAKRVRSPTSLVLHILLLLSAFGLFVTGDRLMLYVIEDPDFYATMGGPDFPAFLSLVVAVVSYFVAVIAIRARDPVVRANGS